MKYKNKPNHVEFFVDSVHAEWSNDNNGYQTQHKAGYHSDIPLDDNQELRNTITMLMEDWGVKVKYHHTEVGGCGQLEVEVELELNGKYYL